MRKHRISSAIRTAFTAAALLTATLSATANACVALVWRAPALSFWDAPPKASDGEVVLKVRFRRTEPEVVPPYEGTRCYGPPVTLVFDVLEVTEGDFQPTQIFLYDSNVPRGADQTGWIVGKPATLYMKHLVVAKNGEPPPAEHPSIAWRPPPCPERYDCRPPNLDVLQP